MTYRAIMFLETAIMLHRLPHIGFIPPLNLGAIAYLTKMYALSVFLLSVVHVDLERCCCHPDYLNIFCRPVLWRGFLEGLTIS